MDEKRIPKIGDTYYPVMQSDYVPGETRELSIVSVDDDYDDGGYETVVSHCRMSGNTRR